MSLKLSFKDFITKRLFEQQEDMMNDDKKRRELLQAKIDAGEVPEIIDASWHRGKFSLGDLRALDYVRRHTRPTGFKDEYEEWDEVIQDITFKMDGKVYKKGDTTSKLVVDRS